MNLFEISEDYKNLNELLEDSEGQMTDEIALLLDNVKGSFDNKVISCINLIKEWNNNLDAIKKEKERLDKLNKTKKNSIDRIKGYILNGMLNADIKKLDFGTDKITVRQNPIKTLIADEQKIDKEFIVTEVVSKIDKKKAKEEYQRLIKIEEEKPESERSEVRIDGFSFIRENGLLIK